MQVAGAEMLVAETIRRIGQRIRPTVLCLDAVGELGRRLQADGIDVVAFDRRPGLDLAVSWRMAKAIRARRLQVIHAHQYAPFFYGALAAWSCWPRPPVIFTEHGRHYPDVVSPRRRLLNRLIFDRLADRVNGVCAFSARSLAEHDGFRAERIDVIENGIDAALYRRSADPAGLKAILGLNPLRRYVANVARLHPVKDQATLVRAFQIVARSNDTVDLLLVGDGPLRHDLEQLVDEMGLTGRVEFMGIRSDVPDLLNAIDVFVLSSVSEAASLTLLEAMASGRPVVATEVGGNPELVRAGLDGLLTPRGDPAAMAAAIAALLDHPDKAAELGRSAAQRVERQFSLDRTIERYWALYRELSAGGGEATEQR
jgi:glycosyltransferase involved in cell wall biosynthesis